MYTYSFAGFRIPIADTTKRVRAQITLLSGKQYGLVTQNAFCFTGFATLNNPVAGI
jgi:hypothetical protein